MQQDPSNPAPPWPQIHSSAHWGAAAPAHRTAATRREGALRYACPVNGSVVLVTDAATLAALTPPLTRLRCPACGEAHLIEWGEAKDGTPA